MVAPVAIVTGGASGIGLSLTRHLLKRGWRVVVADMNTAKEKDLQQELGSNFLFVKTDVADWDSQLELFRNAYEWAGRIDFLAANAGIAAVDSVYDLFSKDSALPEKPNLQTLEVDLIGVYYGIQLFKYYHQKSGGESLGKIVVTISQSGLYPLHFRPTYASAKHGLVGLVRSAGGKLKQKAGVTLNGICPGPVLTGIDADMMAHIPKDMMTPIQLLMDAFDKCIDEDITGAIIECSNKNMYLRHPVDYCDETSRFLSVDLIKGSAFQD